MALPGVFPIYPDNLLTGPYHVSLSLPGPISEISKSVGITSSTNFLIPNIEYLEKFIKGDIGIGDELLKGLMLENFNSPEASKDENVFKTFAKLNKIEIDDINKYKKGDRFVMPKDEIKLDPSFDNIGVKSIEKTLLTSIFETQKPYMEIAKLVIENLANIEDIIARVMPLASITPLSSKSQKPTSNSGSGNSRPKALGYKNGEELKSKLAKIDSYANGEKTSNKFTDYKIISEIYSTGEFDPNINYSYTYIDLPGDSSIKDTNYNGLSGDKDPYQKYKPKRIIFGIYNSKGQPLNPNENLKTVGLNGNSVVEINTPFKKADWVFRSPKWFLPEGTYQWPSYGDPVYVWERGASTRESSTNPNPDADNPKWKIKKYKEGDKDLINKEDAIPGNPMIARFEVSQEIEYRNFFNDYVKFSFLKSEISSQDKAKYSSEIINQIDVQSHLQNVFLYGQVKSSYYERINGDDPVPALLKRSFKPYQIFSSVAANDQDIINFSRSIGRDPGFIWIEPEADYDMKLIRIDPTSKIEYKEAVGEPEVSADIEFFIKNRSRFTLSDGGSFNISIKRNGSDFVEVSNVTEYSLDNWNYEDAKVYNDNTYIITIWSDNPTPNITRNLYSYEDSNITYELVKDNNEWFYKKYKLVSGSDGLPKREYESITEGDITIFKNLEGPNNKVRINSNGKIIRWYYLYDREFSGPLNKVFTPTTIENGVDLSETSYLPAFSIIRNFVINTNTNIDKDNLNFNVTFSDSDTTLYNIRINTNDKFGSILDPSKITNDKLTTNDLFVDVDGRSNDVDRRYGHGTQDNPQRLKVIKRYKLTDLDTESYYIIEGTLRGSIDSNTNTDNNSNQDVNNSTGEEWYTLPDAIGTFKVFLNLLVNIFSKLVPSIQKLLELLKNPLSFMSGIISDKMQENILFLSKETLSKFKESDNIDTSSSDGVKRKRELFNNSNLVNYVYVNDSGRPISILDGFSSIPFDIFGKSIQFGMNLKMGDKSPLNLLSNPKISDVKNLQNEIKGRKETREGKQPNIKSFQNEKSDNGDLVEIKFKDGSRLIEKNSLDEFIIDNKTKYNFVYVDEEVDSKINEADKLSEKGDETSLSKAKSLLQEALRSRPNDIDIQNKIKDIDSKLGLLNTGQQPLLKMIMGIVSVPMKIVAGIIEYLLDFFKSLSNPLTLASKISELLSFEWLFKWFVPPATGSHPLMEIAGIKIDLKKPSEWRSKANTKGPKTNKLPKSLKLPEDIKIKGFKFKDIKAGSYSIDDDDQIVDFNQALNLIFGMKLPKLSAMQFRQNEDGIDNLSSGLLCFIEKLINSIIDFFWSTLGLETLKESPHIKLCNKKSSENNSKILNGDKNSDLEQFIYEVQMPDGEIKQFLNEEELNRFIESNKDINYDFNF